jgi:hypothetical protein
VRKEFFPLVIRKKARNNTISAMCKVEGSGRRTAVQDQPGEKQ